MPIPMEWMPKVSMLRTICRPMQTATRSCSNEMLLQGFAGLGFAEKQVDGFFTTAAAL